MPIGQIIKRAWHLSWKHKFLWIFGIFAGGSSGGSGGSWSSSDFEGLLPEGTLDNLPKQLQGIPVEVARALSNTEPDVAWTNDGMLAWWLFVAAVLIALFIYLGVTFQAALIWSVKELDQGKAITFWDGWRAGRGVFWRFLLLGLYIAALAILVMLLFGVPVFFLVSAEQYVGAIALGVVGILVTILWLIILGIVSQLAGRAVVLADRPVLAGVRESLQLMRHQLGHTALLWIVGIGLGIAAGVGILLLLLIYGIPAFLVGLAIASASDATILIIYAIAAILIFLGILLVASGWAGSFLSAYWTLGYRELTAKAH